MSLNPLPPLKKFPLFFLADIRLRFAPAPTDEVTMTSLELVDFINLERRATGEAHLAHYDFLKKVPMVLKGGEGNFSSSYKSAQNKDLPCYVFPKREACLMAMSYSYEIQAKVFDRMTALEKKLQANTVPAAISVPQTFAEALQLAADQQRLIERATA